MKCTTIVEVEGSNPAFIPSSQRAAKRAGKEYGIKPTVTYPVGSPLTGKGAFVLCTLIEPQAVPADKECYDAVKAHFEKPSMKQRFEMLQNMATPNVLKDLPKGMQRYVKAITEKWSGSTAEKIVTGEQSVPNPEDTKATK